MSRINLIKRITRMGADSPRRMRRLINIWPPLRYSGIEITDIAEDWSSATVKLKLRWWTRNLHGTAYGGSLYSMTDVTLGVILGKRLGTEYEAWTRTSTYQYIAPGLTDVQAEFVLDDDLISWVKSTVAEDGYCLVPYSAEVRDARGQVVGISHQEMHVRPRGGGKRAEVPQHAREPRGMVLEHLAYAVVWQCLHDHPEIMTVLMSELRRMSQAEEQMRRVVAAVLEHSKHGVEELRALKVPEKYLS